MSCGDPHETDCSDVLAEVYLYLDLECSDDRRALIREHLDECSPCLREFGLEEAVKAIVKRSCSDPAPPDLRAKVLSHIAAARTELRGDG
jgi:mycothiol system anti-sigma-R factor